MPDLSLHRSSCFGCGDANPRGLHLSHRIDETDGSLVVVHTPPPESQGGIGVVHGGYLAAMVDETFALVTSNHADIPPATANLRIDFKSSVPAGEEVEVRAAVMEETDTKLVVSLVMHSTASGEVRVEATGIFAKLGVSEWVRRAEAAGVEVASAMPTNEVLPLHLLGMQALYRPVRLARDSVIEISLADIGQTWWLRATTEKFSYGDGPARSPHLRFTTTTATWHLIFGRELPAPEAVRTEAATALGEPERIEEVLDTIGMHNLEWPAKVIVASRLSASLRLAVTFTDHGHSFALVAGPDGVSTTPGETTDADVWFRGPSERWDAMLTGAVSVEVTAGEADVDLDGDVDGVRMLVAAVRAFPAAAGDGGSTS